MWTRRTEDLKGQKLSQLLQTARVAAGEPQIIGAKEPCVVISHGGVRAADARDAMTPHLGRWLVENARGLGDIDLPPRAKDRPIPFDDWSGRGDRGDDGSSDCSTRM